MHQFGLFKHTLLKSTLTVAIITGMTMAASAAADGQVFNIKSQPLAKSLLEYSDSTDIIIMAPTDLVRDKQAPALQGSFSSAKALETLLAGSGLTYSQGEDGSIRIELADATDTNPGANEREQNRRNNLEEIIVTATKRSTGLQDTAMSISALSGETIEKRGLTEMGDYLSTLPGVTMQDLGVGVNSIVIRGIAASPQYERAAVGVYFGESPVSGIDSSGSGHNNLKMVDVNRVEVLRGPQGTLYGSGTMGGTVRIIPSAPDLQETSGRIVGEYSLTGKQGSDNNVVQGVFNLPVIENTLALRGVAYRFDDSGYIDNVAGSYSGNSSAIMPFYNAIQTFGDGSEARDIDDIGSVLTNGFRITALWQPTEQLSVTLGHVWQEADQNGSPGVETALDGEYQQVRATPGTGVDSSLTGYTPDSESKKQEINLTNLMVEYDLGWGSLFSSSSWLGMDTVTDIDSTRYFPFFGPWYYGIEQDNDVFTQEIRFASQFDGPFQLLIGGYYEDSNINLSSGQGYAGASEHELASIAVAKDLFLYDPAIPADAPAGFEWSRMEYDSLNYTQQEQQAIFGEVSYDFSEQFSATIGARFFEYDYKNQSYANGFWAGTITPSQIGDLHTTNKGETYKFNLSWTPNDNTLVYFQWAEGFRIGEALSRSFDYVVDPDNTGYYVTEDGVLIEAKDGTDPDFLENFELGYKASFADQRITINASVYRINWEGLPVNVRVVDPNGSGAGTGTKVNAGKSVSEGVELDSRIYLNDNLLLDLSASYNSARLAESHPVLGEKGDKLPGSADFNFSSGLEYGFNLSGYDAFARIDYAYVSDYYNNISQTSFPAGGYSQIHLKSGVAIGDINVSLFVKNLTNASDFTWVDADERVLSAYRLRPRSVGIQVGFNF